MRTYSEPRQRSEPERPGWWTRCYSSELRRGVWLRIRDPDTGALPDSEDQARKILKKMKKNTGEPPRHIRFKEALEEWIAVSFSEIAPITRTRYEAIFERWRQHFGSRPLASLRLGDIERYHASLPQRRLMEPTSNLERHLLRGFFAWCVEHNYARENLARTLKSRKYKPRTKKKALPPEELERLLECAREPYRTACRPALRNAGGPAGGRVTEKPQSWEQTHTPPDWLHPFCFLASRTLLRERTLRQLTWDMIDIEKGIMHIPADAMKTDESLDLPLTEEVKEYLRDLFEKNRKSHMPTTRVIASLPDARAVARAIHGAARRAGIAGVIGAHNLRVSGATLLLRQGTPLEVVMALGSWSNPETLFKHYRRIGHEELRQAAEKLGGKPASRERA